jgi:hypothetical protein
MNQFIQFTYLFAVGNLSGFKSLDLIALNSFSIGAAL